MCGSVGVVVGLCACIGGFAVNVRVDGIDGVGVAVTVTVTVLRVGSGGTVSVGNDVGGCVDSGIDGLADVGFTFAVGSKG